MDKIASFQIDHKKLKPGLYVSRKDVVTEREVVTTFDVRLKRPNVEEPMTTASAHTIEHIAATYLRNDPLWGERIIYFGPMGCRTGFYLLMAGDLEVMDVLPLVERTFEFVADYEGEIPGSQEIECGNYRDHDLEEARVDATDYYNVLVTAKKTNFTYPTKKEGKK